MTLTQNDVIQAIGTYITEQNEHLNWLMQELMVSKIVKYC